MRSYFTFIWKRFKNGVLACIQDIITFLIHISVLFKTMKAINSECVFKVVCVCAQVVLLLCYCGFKKYNMAPLDTKTAVSVQY